MEIRDLKALHEQRILAFKRGEWGDVIRISEEILLLKPKDPLACHDLCVAYWRRGDRQQARQWAQRTCEAFLNEEARSGVENQMRHMVTLMKAGKSSARYMRHYEVLGEILYEEGAFEAARDHFEQLIQIRGNFSRKYIYVFKCHLHLGNHASAEPQYKRMAEEFPGREGHLLVSFREYLSRHLDDTRSMDLYIHLLDEAGLLAKEMERVDEQRRLKNADPEVNSLARAICRHRGDAEGELAMVQELLRQKETAHLLLDQARLLLQRDPGKGMKSLIRTLQKNPRMAVESKSVIRMYLTEASEGVQEDLCKGMLAVLDDAEAKALMLDLFAELPENALLARLKAEWSGSTSGDTGAGGVTMMLQNLSLTELIKAKMRMEEKLSAAKGEVTYLASDVVGSTRLKEGVSPERVLVTFEAYHKLVDHAVKANGGKSFIDEGDGKISKFTRAVDAVRAAREVLTNLHAFNEKDNKIGAPLQVRIGLHTGLSLSDDTVDPKKVADRVLDVACHMEKYGSPNEIHMSEDTLRAALLKPDEAAFLGWRDKSGVNAYKLK